MSAGHEKTARLLAGLGAADRDWLLAQLAPEERARLAALLDGEPAPADSAIVSVAAQPVAVAPYAARASTEIEALEQADPATVERLFEAEPDWVVAAVLSDRNWSWGPDFLATRSPEALQGLQRHVHAMRDQIRPATRAALLEACGRRVLELGQTEGPVKPSDFERMLATALKRHVAVEG